MNSKDDGFIDKTENWKRFHWFLQVLILSVGLIIVISISCVFYRGMAIYQRYFPLVNASMEMRLEATTSYLWFEEMLGGDETKKLSDILKNLDLADWYAQAMVEGGEQPHLKLYSLKETVLYDEIRALQKQLTRQRELLVKRINLKADSGPGSSIDQVYHSALEEFISNAIRFEIQVRRLIEKSFQMLGYISIGVVFFSIILFLIVGYSFYRYESLRKKNYSEILDMHDALIQKEKMAALGTMTAGIAHEVNSPNTFISLNIPVLKDYLKEIWPVIDKYAENNVEYKVLEKPYAEFKKDLLKTIDNIDNGSSRINRTVSTLKNFSRKRTQTKKSWFKISDTIESVLNICGSKIEFSVDSFQVNYAEGVPEKIFSDPEIIEISLINLLNNAVEAVDKPNSWIELNVYVNSKKGNKATIIEVKDNGRGIKENEIQRIFEPFFSTKSANGGTGLGLYLCHILLHQIGAYIEVDSKVGVESVFRLMMNDR
jgi:signal transduction histidine kinase